MEIIKKLKKLTKFMNDNKLCELEVEQGDDRIKLKKYSNESAPVVIRDQVVSPQAVQPAEAVNKSDSKAGLIEIKSPMVGTFYRAPSPEAAAYVDIGQKVKPGDIVCIVEAMKLMNEIKAETTGTIVEVLVENAEPVEFGQTLFLLKP